MPVEQPSATNTVAYPLGAPIVSEDGQAVTVNTFIDEPTRVTRYLNDLSLQQMFAHEIFTPAGGVSGGAVVYDQLLMNDLYGTRDVQHVEPGAEFPIVTSDRTGPRTAQVEKFGGKFFITDEARDRNDPAGLRMEGVKLANAIARRTDKRALEVLDDAITEVNTGAAQFKTAILGNNWNSVVTYGSSPTPPPLTPMADFAKAQLLADQMELGVTYDYYVINPIQHSSLSIAYGAALKDVLASSGVTLRVSNRVPAGTAYGVQRGMVGEMRVEKPLTTETWREERTQRTWFQSDVRPVFYVTNPYGVVKLTGLGG